MTSVRRDGLCPAALLAVAAVGILAASASIDEAYAHEGPNRTVSMNPEGLTIRPSSYGAKETMDRLAASVVDKGMAILAHIDHATAAAKAGLELRPATDRGPDLRQPARQHASDERGADDRHRPAAKSAGLAGRQGRDLARLQRSELASETSRSQCRNGPRPRQHGR